MAARYVRDVEAPGSNPGSPTSAINRSQPLLMQNAQANDNSISEIDSLQRSVSELTAVIEDNPSDSEAFYQRGVVYGQLVEPVAAIRDFDQVVRLDPTNAEAHYNRGLAYVHLKEQMPAVEDFTQAIRLNPNHADAYNNRAAAFWELGQPKRALEDVAKTLELNDQSTFGPRHRRAGQRLLGRRRRRRGIGEEGRGPGLRRLPAATLHAPGQKAAPLLRGLTTLVLP